MIYSGNDFHFLLFMKEVLISRFVFLKCSNCSVSQFVHAILISVPLLYCTFCLSYLEGIITQYFYSLQPISGFSTDITFQNSTFSFFMIFDDF